MVEPLERGAGRRKGKGGGMRRGEGVMEAAEGRGFVG